MSILNSQKITDKRVVITGIGFVTPVGSDPDTFWKNISTSVTGSRLITRFDVSKLSIKIAATVKNFDTYCNLSHRELQMLDLFSQYALFAAKQGFIDSKLTKGAFDSRRAGVFWGTCYGGIETICRESVHFHENEKGRIWSCTIPASTSNAAPFAIANKFSLQGSNLTFSTACSSSSNAIGNAYQQIKSGQLDLALAGGSDAAVVPPLLQAWSKLRGAGSKQNDSPANACKPFSKNRNGMVLGEGAGIVFCEELEHAQKRGAKIYGEIVGYGTSCDALHITAPSVEGQCAAIEAALEDANLNPEDIDYINSHGTGTQANDRTETSAIKKAFGTHAYKVPINSSKPMLGHMMGACGVMEIIVGLLSMQNNTVHQTINYEAFDEECDLDYVTEKARETSVNTFMSNSFAFGGSNATLIVKRFQQ